MMKAIETSYKGYRFRSRLEARWAVFFDTLGLRWEYEPEGFDLGGGAYYLPDFFLPDLGGGTWVEVKPSGATFLHPDSTKWENLARQSRLDFLLVDGVPDQTEYCVFRPLDDDGSADGCWYPTCFQLKYLPPINHDGNPRLYWCPGGPEDCDVDEAIQTARSARFEHGEVV